MSIPEHGRIGTEDKFVLRAGVKATGGWWWQVWIDITKHGCMPASGFGRTREEAEEKARAAAKRLAEEREPDEANT